jgi:hypothetical protein
MEKYCRICKKPFIPQPGKPSQISCSQQCNVLWQNERRRQVTAKRRPAKRRCLLCKEEFILSAFNWRKKLYCGKAECNQRYHLAWDRSYRVKHPFAERDKQRRLRCNGNWTKVLDRADGHCEMCGEIKKLNVHHRDGSGENISPNHDLENLQAVCYYCHKQIHTINYRIIDGALYVSGKIFKIMQVSEVKVLPLS